MGKGKHATGPEGGGKQNTDKKRHLFGGPVFGRGKRFFAKKGVKKDRRKGRKLQKAEPHSKGREVEKREEYLLNRAPFIKDD